MAKGYDEFLPDIIPIVPGCPDMLIEAAVRSAAIELCEFSKILQRPLDPVTIVAGIYEYELEAPKQHDVHSIQSAVYNGCPLDAVTVRMLEERYDGWRTRTGKPTAFIKTSNLTFNVVPIPPLTEANAINITAVLKPSRSSGAMDDELYVDHYEAIKNNAVSRLLMMPKKDWTDRSAARDYYAMYQVGANAAKKRARDRGSSTVPIVEYGGIMSSRGSDYGNRWKS